MEIIKRLPFHLLLSICVLLGSHNYFDPYYYRRKQNIIKTLWEEEFRHPFYQKHWWLD